MILLSLLGKAIANERKAVNYHFEKSKKMAFGASLFAFPSQTINDVDIPQLRGIESVSNIGRNGLYGTHRYFV